MQSNNHLARVIEERELAYFRAELALFSPESYSVQEKAEICKDMDASEYRSRTAIREDFASLPLGLKSKFFGLLLSSGSTTEYQWRQLLDYWD